MPTIELDRFWLTVVGLLFLFLLRRKTRFNVKNKMQKFDLFHRFPASKFFLSFSSCSHRLLVVVIVVLSETGLLLALVVSEEFFSSLSLCSNESKKLRRDSTIKQFDRTEREKRKMPVERKRANCFSFRR